MDWFTAPSYDSWTHDDVFEDNGKMKMHIYCACGRCGGTGRVPFAVDEGICYECRGAGKVFKTVRAYTEKERAALDKAAERKATAKAEKAAAIEKDHIENEAKYRKEWYANNGFNGDGVTYIPKGNTFEIKDELKAAGFKFDPVLNWHAAEPAAFDCVTIAFDDVYTWQAAAARADYKEGASNIVKQARFAKEINTQSEFVGEIKERLRNRKCTLISIVNFETKFGASQLFKFEEDQSQNIFCWFTATEQKARPGDHVLLTGTVKNHSDYEGEKDTILTRCKVEVQ